MPEPREVQESYSKTCIVKEVAPTVQPVAVTVQVGATLDPAVCFTSIVISEMAGAEKAVVQEVAALTDSNIKIQASKISFAKARIPEDVRQAFKLPPHRCWCACCLWIV